MPRKNRSKDLLSRKEEVALFRDYGRNSFRVNVPCHGRTGVVCDYESVPKSRLELYGFPLEGNSEVEDVVKGLENLGGFDYVRECVSDDSKDIFIGAKSSVGELRIMGRFKGSQKVFYRNNRALDIRNKIVEKNIGLIYNALGFRRGLVGLNYEDYSQDMFFCLDRVIDAFDVGRGCKFSTYAMGAFLKEIPKLRKEKRYSIFPQACSEEGEYEYKNILDLSSVSDSEVFDVGREDILKLLEGREREVMDLRMKGKTLKEVGKRFGLGRERIRQIQNQAIGSLREELV